VSPETVDWPGLSAICPEKEVLLAELRRESSLVVVTFVGDHETPSAALSPLVDSQLESATVPRR
jgi:hypothetical protein